jgi:DNA-binding NarL/FixJ family response regulator
MSLRIVLVEDHTLVRSATKALLDRTPGLEVVAEADTRGAALQAVEAFRPDLVITDIRLKDSNGIELTLDLKARYPAVRTLVLTAYPYEQYLRAMMRAGASGFLLKEATAEELLAAVRDIAEGRPAISGELRARMDAAGPYPEEQHLSRTLTARELEVLELLQVPLNVAEVSERLNISRKTVYAHLSHIQSKLGESTVEGAVRRALDLHLLGPANQTDATR